VSFITPGSLGQALAKQVVPASPIPASTDFAPVPAADAQAAKYANDPRLQTVALWARDPNQVAQTEAYGLLYSLQAVKGEAVPLATELQRAQQEIAQKRARISAIKAQISSMSRQGMGDVIALERESGQFADPHQLCGFMDSVRKAFKSVDKGVIRPIAAPIKRLESQMPWDPLLKKIEKYTIRPAAREAQRGMAVLDKYVPGWTTLLDFVVPIPIGSILNAAMSSGAPGGVFSSILNASRGGDPFSTLANSSGAATKSAFQLAQPITFPLGGDQLLTRFPMTVAKGTNTFITTDGPFLRKLEATAIEALSGFTLAIGLASTMVTGGAGLVAVQTLNAILQTLQAGVTVLKAQEAATALKKQARAIRDAAQVEVAKINAEEQQTLAEIARIQASIDDIKRRRQALARQRSGSSAQADDADDAPESDDQTSLLWAGLAALCGAALIIYAFVDED
jgi:uncharacterized protein YlxW (UPF0749 family)